MTRNRKLVLFLSSVPAQLQRILEAGGFQPQRIKESELGERAPEALALILRFRDFPTFASEFRRTHEIAWRHGLLILIVDETNAPAAALQGWEYIALNERQAHPGMAIATSFPNWPSVALQIAAFAPKIGPGHNPDLVVEPGSIDAEHQFLLRRSFGKFTKIKVLPLIEGASGASVYRVIAFRAPNEEHPIPFLAKIGESRELRQEQDTFRDLVRDFVPFNLRPSIILPLSCYGPQFGILVEDFVERVVLFQDALRAGDPSLLITSLFQGTLRGWRRSTSVQAFSARDVFRKTNSGGQETGIVRNNDAFRAICATAARRFAKNYDPDDVLSRFDRLRVEHSHTCTIHGDLHARNVFVSTGSAACLIIDYANARSGPSCLDPACLEVDLLLAVARPQPGRFLRRAYAWPLRSLRAEDRLHCDPWLWEAVRALRIEAEVASDPRAYVLSLIGYLLRFARLRLPPKKQTHARRKREVALCIAEWLICKLLNDQEEQTSIRKALSEAPRRIKRRRGTGGTRPRR